MKPHTDPPGPAISARTIHRQRRAAASQHGPLVRELMAALVERRRMLDEGVSEADVDKGLAEILRENLPRGRPEPWHYFCEDCRDRGLRSMMLWSDIHQDEMLYVTPCVCPAGVRWSLSHAPRTKDDLAQAGKTKRGMRRLIP